MYADVNGTRLYYNVEGEGTPLMLMHGGLGLDHTWFKPWFSDLADMAQVIYYDHRGNGRSERLSSFDGVTHETWVEDAEALRQHIGADQIVLFGHSYGSFLAQEYALRHQDRLKGLILCAAAPVIDYMELLQQRAAARNMPDQLAALGEAFSRPMTDDADFESTWERVLPLYFKDEVPAGLGEGALFCGDAWNHVNANCLPTFNVLDGLPDIEVPTLIVTGTHDWTTPPVEGGQRIHEAIPGSEFVLFENSAHYPFIEEHDRFVGLVRDWMASL